ncbi:type II toxin-antitoxin system RelE/ParE family toxin [Salegentibacter sp.]|uniref:type II toxin-antitoxin system RelE/ParE family toxin n=1 Tax=Salegentibacter sp. TaxID=1903072 RepID=UPI003566262C
MHKKFNILFLKEAIDFLDNLSPLVRKKIYYNLDKASLVNDPRLFKKLKDDIWEFRTKYSGNQYRLFAFWDKREKSKSLVIATHGIIKKMDKIPKSQIEKAKQIRLEYFKE